MNLFQRAIKERQNGSGGTSMKASDPYRTAYVRILKEELRADQTVCVLAGKGLPAQRGERPAKSRSV
jgi:hypothetical protein